MERISPGGRGPSLFNPALLAERSDDQLQTTILNGLPDSGMPAFKGQLDEARIGRLLAYLRIRSGQLAKAGPAVKDPTNLVLKTKKQTVRIDVVASNIDTPWGRSLPSRRPPSRDRATGQNSHRRREEGRHPATVTGTPTPWVRQDGGFFDIAVAGDPKNPWIYLSYAEILPGYDKPLPGPGPTTKDGHSCHQR